MGHQAVYFPERMLGIGAQYYLLIYYGIVTFLSIMLFSQYENYSENRLDSETEHSQVGIMVFTFLMVFFIGLRPVSADYFVDMDTYDVTYNVMMGNDFIYLGGEGSNLLFDSLFGFMASMEIPSMYFFLVIAAIYFICISWACSLLFPNDRLTSILVYLSAFSTYAYATNGIKAGAAAALFLVALAFYQKREWFMVVLFALLSLGFHYSMMVPIAAFLVCLFVKNPRVFLGIWVASFFLSLFHVTFFQELFATIMNEHGAEYLLGGGGYVKEIFGGFRIDFVLYSIVPMVVGVIAIEKKKIESESYVFLLNLYTLINAVWLLCMYSDYTNRIAYLSWMLYPIVLIYPFLNEEWEGPKYKIFQWVAFGHLVFNLVMVFIYW